MPTSTTVSEITGYRRPLYRGGNPLNFVELYGGTLVEMSDIEPDPRTYRGDYYYNTSMNRLYRRIVTHRRTDGTIKAQWVGCSD